MQPRSKPAPCRAQQEQNLTASLSAYGHDELITISLEGESGLDNFAVSKALLCNASSYFIKAPEGKFAEAQTRSLKLPGCSSKNFRAFLHYILHKSLPKIEITSSDQFDTLDVALWHRMKNDMVRVYAFADTILMPAFAKEALDCLLRMINDTYIHIDTVELIYELSAERLLLRETAVAEMLWTDYCVGYGREEMDRFSALPGFFHDFADVRRNYSDLLYSEKSFPHAEPSKWAYTVEEKPSYAV